jgi:SAM-dependent methyltransferase
VETEGFAEPSELTVDRGSSAEGFSHVPTPPWLARAWLGALAVPLDRFTLVDLGSGRGRVLLLAAERPFRAVVGVEFAAELHAAAVANVARFPRSRMRCGSITPLHEDAAQFVFPPEPLVVYFNNPFSDRVMARVLANLRRSYELRPRPLVLVYQQLTDEEERHSTGNLELLAEQDFLVPREPRFTLLERLRLAGYTVAVHETAEAAALVRPHGRPRLRRRRDRAGRAGDGR